jgi:hypothetical protein
MKCKNGQTEIVGDSYVQKLTHKHGSDIWNKKTNYRAPH